MRRFGGTPDSNVSGGLPALVVVPGRPACKTRSPNPGGLNPDTKLSEQETDVPWDLQAGPQPC